MRLAQRHGLAPLLERHLSVDVAAHVPKTILARLWVRAEARSRRNAAMAMELAAIVRLLQAHGVGSVTQLQQIEQLQPILHGADAPRLVVATS